MAEKQEPNDLYGSIVAEMTASAPVSSGKMFGMPILKNSAGKAFAGFYEGKMVFKLDTPKREQALALKDAHLFDPMKGRPMKEWVVVPAEHSGNWLELAREAMNYVAKAGK